MNSGVEMRDFLRSGLAVVALLVFTTPVRAQERRVLHGHVPRAVTKFNLQSIGRLPSATRLRLAIGLPLRNQETLASLLQQIYDPASPKYRHYLTPEEFTAMFGPTEQDYQAVIAFAASNGLTVTDRHPNHVIVDVEGTAADVEKAFQVKMLEYRHPTEARTFYAPDVEPSAPSVIKILDISGLSSYARPHPLSRIVGRPEQALQPTPNAGSAGGQYVGDDFRAAYVPGTSLTGAGQSVALVQFDNYYASDIAQYETLAGLPSVTLTNIYLDNYNGAVGSGNGEVSLDIEMVISMAPGVSKIFLYEGNPNPPFFIPNDVLSRIANDNAAKQISCSWGWTGGPSASTDNIFMQMASQGQSFFVASGDSDAYPGSSIDDPGEFGTPSASAYVTSVGGTTLSTSGPISNWVSETVWNWGVEYFPNNNGVGSSGGSSSYYAIPAWQQGVSMTNNQGSATGRNFPDVALTADHVFVAYGGGTTNWFGGTSCAAPLWAGFTALVNQQGTDNGVPSVGFLNSAIYTIGTGTSYSVCFHDITTGNNTWSNSPSQFYAVTGYDLCTGWGTPNGTNLINALVGPPIYKPRIVAAGSMLAVEGCAATNGVIDPNETVTVDFALQNTGTANASNVVATLLATNGVTGPSAAQSYGTLVAGAGAVFAPFTFTANGTCGGTITATLQIQTNATNLGTVTYSLSLGTSTFITNTFSNPAAIKTPASGTGAASGSPSSPYPSTINVSGLSGLINKVTVTLTNMNHTYPDDIDVLLVGPGGQSVILMSDTGGSFDIVNVTLTFDDDAATSLPDPSQITSGTYKPTNIGSGDAFPSPAPSGGYGSTLSVFNETNPNGMWSLYVVDDEAIDTGTITSGWKMSIITSTNLCCVGAINHPPVIKAASISPSLPSTTNNLLVTVTSTNDPDGDPVTLAYQWQESTNNLAFTNLTGQTASTLGAAVTVAGDYYRVILTPNDGQTNGTAFTTAAVPVAVDFDGDGLNDDWEIQYFGSLGAQDGTGDPDGDGFSNAQEQTAGTDPTNPNSALRISAIAAEGDDIRITWSAVGGENYVVQTNAPSGDDFTNDFSDLSATIAVPGSGETSTNYLDMGGATNGPARFYRIKLLP